MSLHFAAVNTEGIVSDLDMGPAAYRVLLKIRAYCQPGGRIDQTQDQIAKLVGVSRATVITGMRDLELARLLTRINNGAYQLNPMVAPYRSPEDFVAAIKLMAPADRLDHKDFVKSYKQAAADYKAQAEAERERKAKEKTRRESSLHLLPAVG
ncbi:replication/maintenance protein RepL [Kitasatospora purpeofusca]|uniref:replication/maintenance protein RepL n=1 Tax=Kitasatospora purpeofusca TaxID=67352 RepID=UPI0035E1BB51